MPLSSYYNQARFRAVDEDATLDTMPLTSALEAQLSCSHDWLHENGHGAAPQIRVPGALTLAGYNNTFSLSASWASIMAQPFLVTRGLKSIRVSMLGTVEILNINTRLELMGFKSVETTWVIGGAATTNVLRQTTLVLDEDATVEYETDLVLWGKAQLAGTTVSTLSVARIESGMVEVAAAALSTAAARTLAAISPRWNGVSGFPTLVTYESLFRNPAGATVANAPIGAAVLSERVGGTAPVAEIEIGRITTRSLFVEAFFK